jgi:hypothetical protein
VVSTTIANNTNSVGSLYLAGIGCSGSPVVFNLLLKDNAGNAMEINPTCAASYSGIPGGTTNNNRNTTLCTASDLFVDATANNYKLNETGGGKAGCVMVDVGASNAGGVNAPLHDRDGVTRPARLRFDIGSYEAP